MKGSPRNPPAESFFLKTESGDRFCLYHAPHPNKECRGVFIYVHPFGDEMNKSRRMVALQARAFATMGFGVLQMDLFGCGDSNGEFGKARWDIWKQDLEIAWSWLENISGELFLTQFLRLRLANEMLAGGSEKTTGTQAIRSSLAIGERLEVAGYELAPDLAVAIDSLRAIKLLVPKVPVHWFEIVSKSGRTMPPAGAKVVRAWEKEGSNPQVHLVPCVPFWATQEITECPELISATTKVLSKV